MCVCVCVYVCTHAHIYHVELNITQLPDGAIYCNNNVLVRIDIVISRSCEHLGHLSTKYKLSEFDLSHYQVIS